jgi:hypothetical protein
MAWQPSSVFAPTWQLRAIWQRSLAALIALLMTSTSLLAWRGMLQVKSKYDPADIGPIQLKGLLTLPFLAHAAITGKCK